MIRWLLAGSVALICMANAQLALAAPARLNDEIPDAIPDDEGIWSFGYGYQSIALEGPLTDSTSTHSIFKLRYQVSPDANVAVQYGTHSLGGGVGLLNPLFDNQDDATSLGFDLRLNLLNEAAKYDPPADPNGEPVFTAGSAFDVGVGMDRLKLSGALDQDDTLLRAYLAYSTDLSEQLRAHTYFSTGRVSGDSHTGSMNRVAAGLDYTLTPGSHPLVLMADAILDVYNFRAPTFNTSRITSFDVGMRYGFNPNLYGSLGWMTYNDSENDASGSGLFAGLQWISDGSGCEVCEPANVAEAANQPAAAAPPPPGAATTTIEPANPAPAEAQPPAQAPVVAAPVESAPIEQPTPAAVEPAPAPTITAPAPAPSEDNLILPDGRADRPVGNRVVSSLQQEFASPSAAPAPEAADMPLDEYDPRSWEEQASDSGTEGTAEDNGVELPELQLVPESMQADAKSVRPPLKRKPASGKSTAAAKERSVPSADQTVVEVEIVSDAPEEN